MSRKPARPVCNKDCEHCPYPDCINDTLDYDDYLSLAKMESEIIQPKTAKQRKVAAQQKAYYEANREKVAAQQKAYREANREKLAAQKKISEYRQSIGLTQRAFAGALGVSNTCVRYWEQCQTPANWALLQSVYPDLRPDK